jgi:AcrR family transcriptional regulator
MCAAPRTRNRPAPSRTGIGRPRVDIASIRREEIIAAAIDVIAHDGIEKLSLKNIEDAAGMSRGQLTYYFRTKEQILLAVFDRLLQLIYERMAEGAAEPPCEPSGWEMARHLLETVMMKPPHHPGFHTLVYTFLSQIGHREDFRERLAGLFEEWRGHMSRGFQRDRAAGAMAVPARAMASLVQAILHGLSVQLVADPHAFDRAEMLQLCTDLLGSYLHPPAEQRTQRPKRRTKLSG